MSSNQLVPYMLTEPLPDPSFAPPQRTQPNPDRCSSLFSLCDECQLQYAKVSHDVQSDYLVCPKGSYPVIITFEFLGTPDKARQLVEYFHGRVMNMFNIEHMSVYGAVKRVPNGTDGPGSWLDLTTPGAKFAKTFKPNKGYLTLPSFKDAIETGLRAEYAKPHSKVRQVSILADIPFTINPGGEIEMMMLNKILPEWVDKKAMQHPNTAGHPSMHRLKWWAETHPHAESKEPARQTLNPDPWKRPNFQVRKKKH